MPEGLVASMAYRRIARTILLLAGTTLRRQRSMVARKVTRSEWRGMLWRAYRWWGACMSCALLLTAGCGRMTVYHYISWRVVWHLRFLCVMLYITLCICSLSLQNCLCFFMCKLHTNCVSVERIGMIHSLPSKLSPLYTRYIRVLLVVNLSIWAFHVPWVVPVNVGEVWGGWAWFAHSPTAAQITLCCALTFITWGRLLLYCMEHASVSIIQCILCLQNYIIKNSCFNAVWIYLVFYHWYLIWSCTQIGALLWQFVFVVVCVLIKHECQGCTVINL